MHDWLQMAEGFKDAWGRWKARGCPTPRKDAHIELCRKQIINEGEFDSLLINLNHNLYIHNEGRVFSEGAEFTDKYYIHLKIRDLRFELSIAEFRELIDAIKEAEKELDSCDSSAVL